MGTGSLEDWSWFAMGPFEEIRIQPITWKKAEGVVSVDWVNAWTMHSYGKISVKWKQEK